MKIRNLDNGHTWQKRVREHEDVSNTIYSEEETWQMVRKRLDRASKRKNRGWYWMAAASVVLLVVIKLCIPAGNKTAEQGLTKTPAVHKQTKHTHDANEAIQVATSMEVKHLNPGVKTTAHATDTPDSLQILHAKNKSVVPLPVDSSFTATHTSAAADDMALQPAALPTVHIEDLYNAETMKEPVTIKSLTVKKMIRLFNTDFTKEQPSKKQEKLPPNQYTIPNNQN